MITSVGRKDNYKDPHWYTAPIGYKTLLNPSKMDIQEKLAGILHYKDRHGKKLSYKPEEGGKVYLEIDGIVRCLGHILVGQRHLVYQKFDDEGQIFRKLNAWSINHTVLSVVDDIWYETRTHDYHITKERAMEFGDFLHFDNTTELKVYVPLKYWEIRHKGMQAIYPEEFKWSRRLGDSWFAQLKVVAMSPLMKEISTFVKKERETKTIYPHPDDVFRAFRLTSFEHTKVVMVGMSPYHDGTADGLAFSYLGGNRANFWKGKVKDKSLDVIFQEVERDIYKGLSLDYDYELEGWARQGVLLLNSTLTVEKGKPKSHENIGWERFIRIALYKLLEDPTPKVFMFWGNKAQEQRDEILKVWNKRHTTSPMHLILNSKHPAADLYNENKDSFGRVAPSFPETFAGCKHFSQANEFLKLNKRPIISW